MGDINDGPDFDRYEKQILRSGIEAHIGSVLEPETILHSFVDLSDGKGKPSPSTSSFWRKPESSLRGSISGDLMLPEPTPVRRVCAAPLVARGIVRLRRIAVGNWFPAFALRRAQENPEGRAYQRPALQPEADRSASGGRMNNICGKYY